jgi:hypothetical protein
MLVPCRVSAKLIPTCVQSCKKIPSNPSLVKGGRGDCECEIGINNHENVSWKVFVEANQMKLLREFSGEIKS